MRRITASINGVPIKWASFWNAALALKWRVTRLLSRSVTGGFSFLQTASCGSRGGERAETCDAGCHLTQATKCPGHGQMDDRQRQLLSAVEGFARVKGWEVASSTPAAAARSGASTRRVQSG